MISLRPVRGLIGSLNYSRQDQGRSQGKMKKQEHHGFHQQENRVLLIGPRNVFFSCASFNYKRTCSIFAQPNIHRLKKQLSKVRLQSTNSGDTAENVPNGKIPISLVARFLEINPDHIPTKGKTKKINTQEVPITIISKPTTLQSSSKDLELAGSDPANNNGNKAVVPYNSNSALRNVWSRSETQRPKIENMEKSSAFKNTYERLKRLGLLKASLGHGHVGMTSPSGQYKVRNSKTKGVIKLTSSRQPSEKSMKFPVKSIMAKNKFLDNNMVLKVQHYYNSQGKEFPDELKGLSKSKLKNKSQNSYEKSQRRYQLYPCTSPSSTQITRNKKRK